VFYLTETADGTMGCLPAPETGPMAKTGRDGTRRVKNIGWGIICRRLYSKRPPCQFICNLPGVVFYCTLDNKFMSTLVETKTRELCEALLEEIKTGGIRNRIDTFLADATARGQYEKVMSLGQALQEKQHHGEQLDAAEIASFEADRDILLKNPVASGFLDAQEQMHELQETVQKTIGKAIELGRLPTADELSEGGSCGSGCGCHH